MAIPDYQTVMLPLLKFASDEIEHSTREAIDNLADYFELSPTERAELLPSGQQATFLNRVSWAITHMKKACLLQATRRSHFEITPRGLEISRQNLEKINVKFLKQFPEYIEFLSKKTESETTGTAVISDSEQTPEELMEAANQNLRDDLAVDLIQQIMSCSPAFFEQTVVDLLVRMGYGGSRKDAGQAVGKSGDGGIDGIIKEDRLGLDVIYIQAKRWEGTIGRPEIHKFVGALVGQRAKKGVFITTSSFTSDAIQYAAAIDSKVILISGQELAKLMIDFNIGVSPVRTYEVKRIDSDYFSDT